MRTTAVLALAALLALSATGCWGPEKFTRHMDDWTNQSYVDNPWLMGNTVSWGLLRVIFIMTRVMDSFINAYYFWAIDAEPFGDGKGTKFEHRLVTPTRK